MKFIILTAFLMTLATFKGSAQGCLENKNTIACNTAHPFAATDRWLLNINKRVY